MIDDCIKSSGCDKFAYGHQSDMTCGATQRLSVETGHGCQGILARAARLLPLRADQGQSSTLPQLGMRPVLVKRLWFIHTLGPIPMRLPNMGFVQMCCWLYWQASTPYCFFPNRFLIEKLTRISLNTTTYGIVRLPHASITACNR